MSAPGCADRARCPVPDPDTINLGRMTSVVLLAGTPLRRGHKVQFPADQAVPSVDVLPELSAFSRFAPVIGASHVYVARREIAALLESALHDVVAPNPRIRWPQVGRWALSHVTLRTDIRLIDLRDTALARLGLSRENLVTADPGHYPCTRAWAEHLHQRHVGGRPTHGIIWHSRQAELHASEGVRPLLADILTGEQSEVAVLWSDPDADPHLAASAGPWPLAEERGHELLRDVANLLGAPPPLRGPRG